jgi:hypothetical protein
LEKHEVVVLVVLLLEFSLDKTNFKREALLHSGSQQKNAQLTSA